MSTRWGALQRGLLVMVGAQLKEYGFVQKLSEQSFRKKMPLGLATCHLSFIPHGGQDFDITADVALRLDAVEELTNRGEGTYTMGGDIGNLSIGRQRRWTVATEADLARVVAGIVVALKETGFAFFARFSTLEHVYAVLVKNDIESSLYSPFRDVRWRSVLALAWLLGRTEELPHLIAEGEAFLRSKNDPSIRRFTDFASKIRSLPSR